MKTTVDELGIFSGRPIVKEKLHVGRPNIGDRNQLMSRINDILDQRWLTNLGPYVQAFEEEIAQLVGAKHCIAMCNGTIALEITIRALEMQKEVIVPSMTFIATAHALQWQEITPVFCDIDPKTHNLDPERVESMITPRTTGIIGVHLWGRPCVVDQLAELAQRYNLKLIYDAAHAFGCSHKGQMIGSFGDAEVFSFHATKFFNTLEGGAVVTNNDKLAERIRLMKNFGFEELDKVIYIGTNGKMNEISAAMGLTSLEALDHFIEINYHNYKQYQQETQGIPGVTIVTYDETERNNYQYIVLEIDESQTGISRNLLVDILWAENVMARRYFYPGCHRMEPYRSYFPHAGLLLPETECLVERVLLLPTGTAITSDHISHICRVIRVAIENHQEIIDRLEQSSSPARLQATLHHTTTLKNVLSNSKEKDTR